MDEGATIELTEKAKKILKGKTKLNDLKDVNGFKQMKNGVDPADFTNNSNLTLQ